MKLHYPPYFINLHAFSGHLITFGCNTYGQLGIGDFKEHKGINLVGGVLAGKIIQKVSCGDGYTVVSTSENQVYGMQFVICHRIV